MSAGSDRRRVGAGKFAGPIGMLCCALILLAWMGAWWGNAETPALIAQAPGEEFGTLVRLGDMNWQPFRATIEKYEHGPVPLERLMITPRDRARASQLELLRSLKAWGLF